MYQQEEPRRKKSSKKKNSYIIRDEQTEIKNNYVDKSYEETTIRPNSPSTFLNPNLPDEYQRNVFSDIDGGIRAYDSSMNEFQREYPAWNRRRQETLSKLRDLVAELHKDQLSFNQTNLACKQMNVMSRRMKTNDDSPIDFFASLGAFVTDAIGGINSIAQAFNVDKFMGKFGEIMENDAEHTKQLYAVRSKCLVNYENVEEIIRRYHMDTFGSTLNKISKSLNTEDMWLDLKTASNGNNFIRAIEKVDDFLRQVSMVHALNEARHSVSHYVDSNPAVLEACEATGKALYGIYDTWGHDRKSSQDTSKTAKDRRIHKYNRNHMTSNRDNTRGLSSAVNIALISREDSEIRRLSEMLADEDEPQAKLELKIREAIEDFEVEAREMENLYQNSLRSVKNLPNYAIRNFPDRYQDTTSRINKVINIKGFLR